MGMPRKEAADVGRSDAEKQDFWGGNNRMIGFDYLTVYFLHFSTSFIRFLGMAIFSIHNMLFVGKASKHTQE